MKLELKHLAPYLPYNLYMKHNSNEEPLIASINLTDRFYSMPTAILENFKPILRPLSDLNNPEFYGLGENKKEYIIGKGYSADLIWDIWEYLFENHFDVFGLIENNLAIDINTLKQ